MATGQPTYLGPRLRRLRRNLGLTQAQMAADLEISASYVTLLERNQRPVTADMLLRLARTYKLDMVELASDDGPQLAARLQQMLRDPLFADIDLPQLEVEDVASNFPGIAEAMLRLHSAARQDRLALADRVANGWASESAGRSVVDPVAEVRRFLADRRNSFPLLDDFGEQLAGEATALGGLPELLRERHGLRVRYLSDEVLMGSLRRYDLHHERILLSDALDRESRLFQLAVQLAHLAGRTMLDGLIEEGAFADESSRRLARRALASYLAAAIRMPYGAFAKAVEDRAYDIEALARQFDTSFEQTAHRLTTLQKPGHERVPFFFLRVDQAGNVSKRLDGAGLSFARHGGGCPLWSVHSVFQTPGRIVPQWLELPDGQRFFSVARTVRSAGGGFANPPVERAIALGCAAEDARHLIYTGASPDPGPGGGTPIGIGCRLCHRADCAARALPPLGRALLSDEMVRGGAPYGFADE